MSAGLHLLGRRWLGFESSAFMAPRRDAMADAVAAHERYTCPMDPPPANQRVLRQGEAR